MGYMKIPNLYRPEAQAVLAFREVYALEKVHGTSAHLTWDGEKLTVFPGGEKLEKLLEFFDGGGDPYSGVIGSEVPDVLRTRKSHRLR